MAGTAEAAAPVELAGVRLRPASEADLPACEAIWRDGLNGYMRPLGFPDVALDNPGLRKLHAHTLATDPSRFWVAERDGDRIAFGSAVQRGRVWFLSMLFVNPDAQARGLGRAILERILPASSDGVVLSTVTDSAQPISNALYATLGIVPRVPLFHFLGRPRAGWTGPPLPAGFRAEPIEAEDAVFLLARDELDRDALGFDHGQDHDFARTDDRRRFAYRDGGGRIVGYGDTSLAGRVGPIALADPALLAPVVAHLLVTVEPRGASSLWLAGTAGDAIRVALDAGLRIDGFPLLVGWSAPFVDLGRYVPISPGLL